MALMACELDFIDSLENCKLYTEGPIAKVRQEAYLFATMWALGVLLKTSPLSEEALGGNVGQVERCERMRVGVSDTDTPVLSRTFCSGFVVSVALGLESEFLLPQLLFFKVAAKGERLRKGDKIGASLE